MKQDRSITWREGRDEMNLADFPISALPRAQKSDQAGSKMDRLEFTATRYDPTLRQRVRQKVTLTSTARDGLPTPADEHVILALLYVAKHSNNFTDSTVLFSPSQLFEIMGWSPNGRSYQRLRQVLRRLKALTIRYENAWWDVVGRAYEEEVATGIISGYRIARQVSGPRQPDSPLASWVTWTQAFHDSLKAGNLKRLDLQVFFGLQTPTAQRMYRFLDKRFYASPTLTMDLVEFACGHIGLTEVDNVAVLKRRLSPALAELESIGFLQPADVSSRFQKVRVGQWRIILRAGEKARTQGNNSASVSGVERVAAESSEENVTPAAQLSSEFYRLWDPGFRGEPSSRDLEQAQHLLQGRSLEEALALLGCLVKVTRKEWPDCKSLSGAVQKYLPAAEKIREQQLVHHTRQLENRHQRESIQIESQQQRRLNDFLELKWRQLPEEQRTAIEQHVRMRLGHHAPRAFVHRLCLEEAARLVDEAPSS